MQPNEEIENSPSINNSNQSNTPNNEKSTHNTSTSPKKLSLTQANAPTISTPVTPFQTSRSRSAARTAAIFYAQCHLQGIPPKEADDAALKSQEAFHDWWRQERFIVDRVGGDGGDLPAVGIEEESSSVVEKQLWRKKRRFNEIHHMLPATTQNDSTTSLNSGTIPVVSEGEDDTMDKSGTSNSNSYSDSSTCTSDIAVASNVNIEQVKNLLLQALVSSNGDTNTEEFLTQSSLLYDTIPTCPTSNAAASIVGNWVSLSKPDYPECLGMNENGDFMYTLGRMSFDMFRPAHLRCCIHGIFNVFGDALEMHHRNHVAIPWNIRKLGSDQIRNYNISVSFTIEAPTGTVRALLINYGFIAPDPNTPRRYSIWFTHGTLEEDPNTSTTTNDNNDEDSNTNTSIEEQQPSPEWINLFGGDLPQRPISEKARILAARVLLGATIPEGLNEDGTMEYSFKRPIGGYNDVLYMDHTLQILRGQHGSMYVLHRI